MSPLARSLLLYLPVNLVMAGANFGAVVIYTRLMGAESYGRYALILAGVYVLHAVTLLWIESAAYRFHARAAARGALPAHFATLHKWFLICAAGSAAVAVPLLLFVPLQAEWRLGIGFAITWQLAETILNIRTETLRAEGRPVAYTLITLWRVGIGFLTGLVVYLTTDLGAAAPFAGLAVATILAALVVGRTVWGARAGPGRANRRLARLYAVYALPLSAVLMLDIVLGVGDRFVIAAFLGEAAVGVYAAAYGVADKLLLLMFAWAGMASSPVLVRAFETEGEEAVRRIAREAGRSYLLIGAPAAAGLALVAAPLAQIVIAPEMNDGAAELMPWISAGAFFNGFTIQFLAIAFQLTRRTATQAACTAAIVVLNVLLNLALLPVFGLLGAAMATVICYACAFFLFWWFARRRFPLPLPFADAPAVALACAGMAGAVLLVPDGGGLPQLLAEAAAGAATYAILAYALDAAGARGWVHGALALLTGIRGGARAVEAHPEGSGARME